jgi:hypothetical protein
MQHEGKKSDNQPAIERGQDNGKAAESSGKPHGG